MIFNTFTEILVNTIEKFNFLMWLRGDLCSGLFVSSFYVCRQLQKYLWAGLKVAVTRRVTLRTTMFVETLIVRYITEKKRKAAVATVFALGRLRIIRSSMSIVTKDLEWTWVNLQHFYFCILVLFVVQLGIVFYSIKRRKDKLLFQCMLETGMRSSKNWSLLLF